jgi:hypothetical protein
MSACAAGFALTGARVRGIRWWGIGFGRAEAVEMAGEIATVAADVMPYVTAAAGAYGAAVLAKAKDDAASATVGAGRRLLQRIFGRKAEGERLPEVLTDVIDNPRDQDYLTALQSVIAIALKKDAQILAEVREILAEASPRVSVSQNVHAGRDAYVAGRDQKFTR